MEEKHKSRLAAEFTGVIKDKTTHVLDIPDEYSRVEAAPAEQLEQAVGAYIGTKFNLN